MNQLLFRRHATSSVEWQYYTWILSAYKIKIKKLTEKNNQKYSEWFNSCIVVALSSAFSWIELGNPTSSQVRIHICEWKPLSGNTKSTNYTMTPSLCLKSKCLVISLFEIWTMSTTKSLISYLNQNCSG